MATRHVKGASTPYGPRADSPGLAPPHHSAGFGRRLGKATHTYTQKPLASRGQAKPRIDSGASGPAQPSPAPDGLPYVPLQVAVLCSISGIVLIGQGEGEVAGHCWCGSGTWAPGPAGSEVTGRGHSLLNEGPKAAPHTLEEAQHAGPLRVLEETGRLSGSTHRLAPHAAGRAPGAECGQPRARCSGSLGMVPAPSCLDTPPHVALEGPLGRKGPRDVVGVPMGASRTGSRGWSKPRPPTAASSLRLKRQTLLCPHRERTPGPRETGVTRQSHQVLKSRGQLRSCRRGERYTGTELAPDQRAGNRDMGRRTHVTWPDGPPSALGPACSSAPRQALRQPSGHLTLWGSVRVTTEAPGFLVSSAQWLIFRASCHSLEPPSGSGLHFLVGVASHLAQCLSERGFRWIRAHSPRPEWGRSGVLGRCT